jgi:hypothetical protein
VSALPKAQLPTATFGLALLVPLFLGDASKWLILSIPSAAGPLCLLLLQSFLFVFQHLAYLSDEGFESRSVLFSRGLFAKLQETFLCVGLHFISQA